ncbi:MULTISPECIES: ABC transporter ATP-binding protein/permease [Bradyrhizobium]|uniref:ABC transporter ATP-binding protein/permease n=7 Tax=Bradyrhizobium TaxID=374 RepID=A0ABS5G5W4_9BRAD|nr:MULTISPECIES: ABC transporter ATP-binding protein/permease [Bradyrhizobium]MBR1136541.1 ABC transporter ATP-binding protein/permease [Bradyrhizobium denitrificans]MDU0955453.1 ABC transporter ATP-binding protein/permease [Bradyrhizobium sp.]MDU1494589.1 ABC transporter ATP-binding protein/permease [Bradyrhizobium sp.]MDU1547879.1 ABC transporter ATP-binding protein/permease [Bradyrhizobium sp.]MDU1803616.1 ABC transporter ATP-binding protein/permease [Bradyrhizobium sp.]
MNNLRSTLAIVWRIAIPYFRSEDKVAGRSLLAAVIAIELSLVAIDVLVNQWYNRFYNALQDRNWSTFTWELGVFIVLASVSVALSVYQLYLNQWLQIRWRQWMTRVYLSQWLDRANHYRMQLKGDAADNPDQRIADDVQMFVEKTLSITIGLLSSIVTLASFVVILWGLSEAAPLTIGGQEFAIPGYLVWAALIYAIFGTALTHWIGSPLVNLSFQQQRFEADFRFNLVRVRENSEQIALLRGEHAERGRLMDRFGSVIDNWYNIMSRTKRLTAFTASYSQAAVIFPFILTAPAYFAGKIQLGGMLQTSSAFGSVQKALSFFVSAYRTLADWRAIVARLDGFEMSIESAATLSSEPQTVGVVDHAGDSIELAQLLLKLPNGLPLIAADGFSIKSSERTLLTGPSGAGKSTLFRAIAGVWPFGSGAISVPAHAKLMMLPQRPYFPIGTLQAAIVYPAAPDSFSVEQVKDAVAAVGLPQLADRLDEDAHWNRMLSLGEQQRLGMARALLHGPQYLFLDEATASLDEPSEARLYRVIAERLPQTTVVSIGHRSTLHDFHDRKVELIREGDRFTLRPTTPAAAADAPTGGAE